ncbi:MAG: sigma-70 family RNA polymerase sigma factor [Bacteroidales bacterium]|jgi:RNA polymerase sigma factor (sigma-70 family)|nr:sigma-70 family RNA polymerase sigma factor [Bacteroidales bacterium]
MKQQDPRKNNHQEKLKLKLEDDRRLWLKLKQGDTIALNSLFTKYYNDLFFYGIKLVGTREQTADRIQDLFANIWENRKNLTEVANIKAYLFTALRNNLLKPNPKNILNRAETVNNLNSAYQFDISPEEIYLESETIVENRRIIEELLAELSPKQKEIIYLKFYGNYSNIEISEILEIKQQSVANLIARTIKVLQNKQIQHNLTIFNVLILSLL